LILHRAHKVISKPILHLILPFLLGLAGIARFALFGPT